MRKIIALILIFSMMALVACTPNEEVEGSTPVVPENTPIPSDTASETVDDDGFDDPDSAPSESDSTPVEPDLPESAPETPETEATEPETPEATEPETTKKSGGYITLPRDEF